MVAVTNANLTPRPQKRRLRSRVLDLMAAASMGFACLVLALATVAIAASFGSFAALIAVAVGTPLLIWRPVGVVYTLAAGTVLFETYELRFPDSLTDKVPFFQAVDTLGLVPIALNVAELLMLASLGTIMALRLMRLQPPLVVGTLWAPMGVFALVLLGGIAHGVMTGGEMNIVAYEVRGLLYLVLAYLLTVNLVKSKGHVRALFWLMLAGVGVKAVLACWRYAVTLQGDLSRTSILSTNNSLMSHEESYFFALVFLFISVAWLLKADKSQLLFASVLAVPVAVAFLANQRRASVLILLVGLLLIATLVYITTHWRRRVIVVVAVAAFVVTPMYVLSMANAEGLVAEPASALASVYQPDERDFSSNEYRSLENENLRLNIERHALLGDGFGKPILQLRPVPDLTDIYSLWSYIPHNTVLWIWHRVGFIGFVVFWFLAGRLLISGIHSARYLNDSYLRLVSIMAVVGVVGWLVLGLFDQGFASFRPSLFVGLLAGLLSVLPSLDSPRLETSSEGDIQGGAS